MAAFPYAPGENRYTQGNNQFGGKSAKSTNSMANNLVSNRHGSYMNADGPVARKRAKGGG